MRQGAPIACRAVPAERGFSLLVVLVLLGAIALGSAAALRRSAGSTQLARAQLMRSIAHEQAQPAWASAALWRAGTALATVPVAAAASAGKPPVCLVQTQTLPEQGPGVTVYLVNARGFSPDHRSDTTSGETTAGTVVWLQSTLLIENAQVRARLWRRILNPPLR